MAKKTKKQGPKHATMVSFAHCDLSELNAASEILLAFRQEVNRELVCRARRYLARNDAASFLKELLRTDSGRGGSQTRPYRPGGNRG